MCIRDRVWIVSLFSFGWAHQGQLGSPWAFLPPHCALFAPAQAIHSVASKSLILASIMGDLSIDRSPRHHLFRFTQVQYLEVLLHKPVLAKNVSLWIPSVSFLFVVVFFDIFFQISYFLLKVRLVWFVLFSLDGHIKASLDAHGHFCPPTVYCLRPHKLYTVGPKNLWFMQA